MIDKRVGGLAEAVEGIDDGATILVSGFGDAGIPVELCHAVLDRGVRDLTIVTNNGGSGETDIAALIREKRVAKLICSYPRSTGSHWFKQRWDEGALELELVPQGTLSERMRAAGAGLGGFFTPTGAETELAQGKETRMINGRLHVLEQPLPGDFALVHAQQADRWGNLTYHLAARNFGPTMATAAATTIVQVREFVELGGLNPEHIITPGIFVDRIVEVG
ncbi:3-oxoacid CoA-transferase subunit A [Epidermidibacterium keratini]|uniref:3-oxoacid CoA-transferase subunit A n=1 Tax=Epidermidibacterium keratini TaxID=1891644 RepID=A0A7L4YTB0_9ACTN|nr:3-oxoacid CoA-transferase subunit A [Epidermidibacterium keratini]QHC02009.1 3-oxoacid CoA-transferase subunit A [Epidermidibacterium keratini]